MEIGKTRNCVETRRPKGGWAYGYTKHDARRAEGLMAIHSCFPNAFESPFTSDEVIRHSHRAKRALCSLVLLIGISH